MSGILLALSFTHPGHPAFAWIALTPLLVALARRPGARLRAFGLGFIAGAVYFAGTVYWTGATVRTFGGLSAPLAVLVAALLVAYLALRSVLLGKLAID